MTQPSNLPPAEIPIRPRHIRAPQGDGATLIEPPVSRLSELLDRNEQRTDQLHYLGGYRFEADCLKARELFVQQAIDYTPYKDNIKYSSATKLIVSGHQPELFHPGVWLKNFVLSRCGQSPDTLAINLIVDNDVARHTSIKVPVGDARRPHLEEVPLDAPAAQIPFEERQIVSLHEVKSFPDRLRRQFDQHAWIEREPHRLLADELWQQIDWNHWNFPSFTFGELISSARHILEQQLGLQTLELPLSTVARTQHFRDFAFKLMLQLPRFLETYNRSLTEYRIVNKIRSSSHPVPALAVDDGWLEAPFWIWTKENPRRRRVFVRQERLSNGEREIQLSDRDQLTDISFLAPFNDVTEALSHWQFLEETHGIKIRPRALITTMYARLFLSDLFIHGIGGAKYDELTDAIIRRYFGIEPPAFMTVTGTVKLPIPRPEVSAADVLSAKQLIREIRFHPEKFANDASPAIRESAQQFAARKAELLREHQFHFRGASPEQFRALDDLNRQLQLLLTDVEIRLRDELKDRERDLHAAKILGSREFSFVLHPANTLPDQLKRMAASS